MKGFTAQAVPTPAGLAPQHQVPGRIAAPLGEIPVVSTRRGRCVQRKRTEAQARALRLNPAGGLQDRERRQQNPRALPAWPEKLRRVGGSGAEKKPSSWACLDSQQKAKHPVSEKAGGELQGREGGLAFQVSLFHFKKKKTASLASPGVGRSSPALQFDHWARKGCFWRV